jgi:hypothetical protein
MSVSRDYTAKFYKAQRAGQPRKMADVIAEAVTNLPYQTACDFVANVQRATGGQDLALLPDDKLWVRWERRGTGGAMYATSVPVPTAHVLDTVRLNGLTHRISWPTRLQYGISVMVEGETIAAYYFRTTDYGPSEAYLSE